MNTTQKKTAMSFVCNSVKPGLSKTANKPMPTSANALLNASENHAAKPPIVPIRGPMLRSMKKNVPPAFGMAVASSALENIAGMTKRPAITYDMMIAGPTSA